MKTPTIVLTFCALLVVGCERTPNSGAKASQFADPPISMTVKQRSTTAVPGTGDALRLTIGDITRGRVMVSLSAKDGSAVLAPVSLRAHGTARFKYGNGDYVLRLTKLYDPLIGEDFASFFIADSASDAVPEDTKIEQLLALIEGMDDAILIRNGTEYSPKDGALHLRDKWLRNETESARKFIEDHASRSSESGEPYKVLFPNGTTVPLGDYLRERLGEIEFP